MTRRVLVAVAGSAGDLFPLVPVVQTLIEQGHDVRCVVAPNTLAVYLRVLGIPTYPIGSGREVAAVRSPRAVTDRFGGWASLHDLSATLLLDSLPDDVAAVEGVVAEWRPDLIVTSTFVPSARIVARRLDIEQVDVTIYPLLARIRSAPGFAQALRVRCAVLAGLPASLASSHEVTQLAWGVGPRAVLLHDPALLDPRVLPIPESLWNQPVGFPSWDDALRRKADDERVERWLDESDRTTVIVTMGSYLGAGRHRRWRELVRSVSRLDVRGLFLGPLAQLEELLADVPGDHCVARYVPLSRIAGRTSAIVHHAGAGTMVAALRAGTPSVVTPLAYDQIANARLIDTIGAGVHAEVGAGPAALEQVLGSPRYSDRCQELAKALIPTAVAVEEAAARVLAGGR